MLSGKARLGAALGLSVAFLLVAMITIVAFLSFGAPAPSERTNVFYIWLAVACAAEFILFAWTANWLVGRQSDIRVSGAVIVIIHVMIVIWLVITLYTAFSVTGPRRTIERLQNQIEDLVSGESEELEVEESANRYNDPIAFAYMILTFLFFFGAASLYAVDIIHQQRDRITQAERKQLRVRAPDAQHACVLLRKAADDHPNFAVKTDRLAKRLEGIRTNLDYAPPAKAGTIEEPGGISVADINQQITNEMDLLTKSLKALESDEGNMEATLQQLEAGISRLELLVQQRQQRLLT